MLEKKSLNIHVIIPEAKRKGYIINDEDHPSLIETVSETKNKEEISIHNLNFRNKGNISAWDENSSRHITKFDASNQNNFPSLTRTKNTVKN